MWQNRDVMCRRRRFGNARFEFTDHPSYNSIERSLTVTYVICNISVLIHYHSIILFSGLGGFYAKGGHGAAQIFFGKFIHYMFCLLLKSKVLYRYNDYEPLSCSEDPQLSKRFCSFSKHIVK